MVRLPPPVRPGDRVGVAALSGPVDGEGLERGLDALRELGFEPVPAGNLGRRHGIFAGTDEERLAAFHELAGDRDLPAILFARGGSGLLRVLPRMDWELLRSAPRAYVGYSDLTPFLLEVVRRLRLVAFHGPMVAADLARGLTASEEESFLGALEGRYPSAVSPACWAREGSARGVLSGGCLSLLTAVLGTPWAPDLSGSILFLEDVDEPEYRVDRMLTHLRLSGSLSGIRGVVTGQLGGGWDDGCLGEWQLDSLAGEYPIAFGFPAGHGAPNMTLPLGLEAVLDSRAGEIRFEVPSA